MSEVNHANMKLGKLEPKIDPRVPHGARYLAFLGAPPASADWYSKVRNWPMMGNDSVGDCTCAGVGHIIEQWTTYAQAKPQVMVDDEVLHLYSLITGYKPGDEGTDKGAYCVDVLTYWAKTGIGDDSNKLLAFGTINVKNQNEVKSAIAAFGNAYIGVELPLSAQTQLVWDVPTTGSETGPGEVGSWGGHCIPLVGYDAEGVICVTWGALKRLTWAFLQTYGSEAYVLLDQDFIGASGMTPGGLDIRTLQVDMQAIVEDWPLKDGVVVNPHEEELKERKAKEKAEWEKAKEEEKNRRQQPVKPDKPAKLEGPLGPRALTIEDNSHGPEEEHH